MKNKLKSFTLIELLMVVGIILILAAILFPSLYMAKWTARFQLCKTNVRTLAVGGANYANDNSRWYPDGQTGGVGGAWSSDYREGRALRYYEMQIGGHFNAFAKYFGPQVQHYSNGNTRTVTDSKVFSTASGFMQCPSGERVANPAKFGTTVDNLNWHGAFYGWLPNVYHGQASITSEDRNGDGAAERYFSVPHEVMRRLGDKFKLKGNGDRANWWYDISAICNITESGHATNPTWGSGYSVSWHTWGGEPDYVGTGAGNPFFYGNRSGLTRGNFGMQDGSVVDTAAAKATSYKRYYSKAFTCTGVNSGGAYYLVPNEYAEKEP